MSEQPPVDLSDISPLDRAAILLLTLGERDASEVLKHLDPREVQRVGGAMALLENVNAEHIAAVMDEFLDTVSGNTGLTVGADDYVRRMLVGALGEDKARSLLDRILGGNTAGLEKLKWMDSRAIAEFIMHEHPQIQAIVMSYLDPDQSAEVLGFFDDPEERTDILMRVASLETVPPSALKELSAVLEQQVAKQSSGQFAQLGGSKVAAEILNNLDSETSEEVMDGIKEQNEDLSVEIQDLMFVFENLASVDDRGIQTILREVSSDNLVLALKGADATLQEKIYTNMSKRAAELLQDDMEAKGPVRLSDVESAQKEILIIARKLADAGEIMLGGSGGEQMV